MNIEEAKLILQSYRTEAEDDPLFAKALDLARADQKLASWFDQQQRFDSVMREALRSEVPPVWLRETLIAAKTLPFSGEQNTPAHSQSKPLRLLAIAASVIFIFAGVLFLRQETTPSMTVAGFSREALAIKEQNRIVLGTKNTDPAKLRNWLAERGAPHEFVIPPGLQGIPSLGCQSYLVHGKKVALICFDLGHNQVAHLFVVEKSALADASSETHPQVRSENGLAFAAWTTGGKSFVLTGDNVTEETLRSLI